MTAEERRQKAENAEKSMIIESRIIMRLEALGTTLRTERKVGLGLMTTPELQRLADDLQAVPTAHAATSMIVGAICDSADARRKAEDAKYDAIPVRARMDMDFC